MQPTGPVPRRRPRWSSTTLAATAWLLTLGSTTLVVVGLASWHSTPGCLPATGWISQLGLRWGLLYPYAGCESGTWAMSTAGVLVIVLGATALLLVTAERGHAAGRRLGQVVAVLVRTLLPTPGPAGLVAQVAVPPAGRQVDGSWCLRGPPRR